MRLLALLACPQAAACTVPTSGSKAATAGCLRAKVLGTGLAGTVRATRILDLNCLFLEPTSKARGQEVLGEVNGDMSSAAPGRKKRFVTQGVSQTAW